MKALTLMYKQWDFTLNKYQELCSSIFSAGYTILTCESYLLMKLKPREFVILRHDIDEQPSRALRMAKIEGEMGIKATYYFKFNKKVFQPHLIKEIASMGHEIGYHYEVVDRAKGDYNKAIQIFEKELSEFRKIYDVKTLSSHGNSLTKWDNRDLWRKYDFGRFGIIGEAYLSLDDAAYFSDTGRTWNKKYKIKDKLLRTTGPGIESDYSLLTNSTQANTTNDLILLINGGNIGHLCILAHPNNWSGGPIEWFRVLIVNIAMNLGKRIILGKKIRKQIK